jgi:hypothetical protein
VSPEEVRDRLEIADLLQRYFTALDAKDYELLERVFVPGAKLHYEMGPGSRPSAYPEMVQAFRDFNASFLVTIRRSRLLETRLVHVPAFGRFTSSRKPEVNAARGSSTASIATGTCAPPRAGGSRSVTS